MTTKAKVGKYKRGINNSLSPIFKKSTETGIPVDNCSTITGWTFCENRACHLVKVPRYISFIIFVWELQTKNSQKFRNSFAYFFHIYLECFEKSQYRLDRGKTPSGIINGLVLYYTMLYYVINKLVNKLILKTSNLGKQRDYTGTCK